MIPSPILQFILYLYLAYIVFGLVAAIRSRERSEVKEFVYGVVFFPIVVGSS